MERSKLPRLVRPVAVLRRRSKSFSDLPRENQNRPAPAVTINQLLATSSRQPLSAIQEQPNRVVSKRRSVVKPALNKQPPGVSRTVLTTKRKSITTNKMAPPNKRRSVVSNAAGTKRKSIVSKTTASSAKPTTANNVQRKPAPYDYKARFSLLLEKHNELKEKNSQVVEENKKMKEDITKMAQDLNEFTTVKEELTALKPKYEKLELKCQLQNVELTNLHEQVFEKTRQNDQLTEDLERVKQILHEKEVSCRKLEGDIEKYVQLDEEQKNKIEQLVESTLKFDNERRKLHNDIQDLKGTIRVYCRVRPALTNEDGKPTLAINYKDESTLEISNQDFSQNKREHNHEFSFNQVFPDNANQEEVFEELSQLVQSVLDGFNVCVFAYGQTGSGKTYTMEGGAQDSSLGMIPRTIKLLFKIIKERAIVHWKYDVKVSFLEIYNEKIYDLLNSEDQLSHEIRMVDESGRDVYVTNLTIMSVNSVSDLYKLLRVAQGNRAVACTQMNERSSRSHAVTKIEIFAENTNTGEKYKSYLNLVDLAGSERLRDTESLRLAETKNINKSLANLSNVILNLQKKNDHIPYRNSKLTHLLMPSLGGNSKTLMFVNISPLIECFNETLNSLRFAAQVNSCKVGVIRRNKLRK